MKDVSLFMNNILYCVKDTTKLEKHNISSKTKEILPKNFTKIMSNHHKKFLVNYPYNNALSEHIKYNSELTNKKNISSVNNKRRIYDYKSTPRKNIMYIKTISTREKTFTSRINTSIDHNISFSYITPSKSLNNNSIYYIYNSLDAKTASSSNKVRLPKKKLFYKINIRNENLISKFNEERKNLKKPINYTFHRINSKTRSENNDKLKEEKMKEIKKKNERRQKETKRLLINVKKKKCSICNKLINHYAFQMHYSCHPSQIFPWIYLGNFINANNLEEIIKLKIKYILNCAMEVDLYNLPKEIKYLHLNIIDNPKENLLQYFDRAFSFFESARKNNSNILIHCKLGRSRSTSILIAYLVKYFGYNVNEALEMIKSKRKEVNPNYGFIQQLYGFERYISKFKNNINNGMNNYSYIINNDSKRDFV